MLKRGADALAAANNSGTGAGYVQVGSGGGGATDMPGPGSYLDMSQDSSFVAIRTTNE